MAKGRVPFRGGSSGLIMDAILNRTPVAPILVNPDIPPALQEVIRRALEKDINLRYQHAADMRVELQRLKRDIDSGQRPAEEETGSVLIPTPSYLSSTDKRRARTSSVGTAALRQRRVSKIIDSLAVLPFENASGDPEREYLSDGITGSLINILATVPKLRVMAQSTAFRYKGRETDPQAIGRELNVRAVLMGRIHQIGDTLNTQVDLVDARTGAQLWGEEYESKVSDLISVKQTIAREVTEKLRLRLSGEEQQRLVRRDT